MYKDCLVKIGQGSTIHSGKIDESGFAFVVCGADHRTNRQTRTKSLGKLDTAKITCKKCLKKLSLKLEIKPHIELLLDAEKSPINKDFSFMWGRLDSTTIFISTVGYKVMPHHAIEALLLKYGCNYAFEHCKKRNIHLQHWDKQCGRTFTYFTEPIDTSM